MSCWPELTDAQQDDLITTLQSLLQMSTLTTNDISQVVLNLEEFMAHVDKVGFCGNIENYQILSEVLSNILIYVIGAGHGA